MRVVKRGAQASRWESGEPGARRGAAGAPRDSAGALSAQHGRDDGVLRRRQRLRGVHPASARRVRAPADVDAGLADAADRPGGRGGARQRARGAAGAPRARRSSRSMDGVLGFVYHMRGIRRLPGGFGLGRYNIVMGPPVFAPLLICMVGVLGLLAGLLRRERTRAAADAPALHPAGARWRSRYARRGARSGGLAARIAHGRFQRADGADRGGFRRAGRRRGVLRAPARQLQSAPDVDARSGSRRRWSARPSARPSASAVARRRAAGRFGRHLPGRPARLRAAPAGHQADAGRLPQPRSSTSRWGRRCSRRCCFCSVGLLGLIAALLRRRER